MLGEKIFFLSTASSGIFRGFQFDLALAWRAV